MKTTKHLSVIALILVSVLGTFAQTSPRYSRQAGGDFGNFLFNRNNVSLLYRKMKSDTRAIRYNASFLPTLSYSSSNLPDYIKGNVNAKLKNNKVNYFINPYFA